MFKILSQYNFVYIKKFTSNRHDIVKYFNIFDIFLNLSRDETFGKTNVESQACGTPVIARNLPVFQENVFYGKLLSDITPKSVINAIENISQKEYNPQSMHQKIHDHFSLLKMGKRYINLYNDILRK